MRLPNLIIVGAQKSGTTWLHEVLSTSHHIFGSETKELRYWQKPPHRRNLEEYCKNFPTDVKSQAQYYLESTPGYFQVADKTNDTASELRDGIPDVQPIVILRNPIDRYRSAYTHHMGKLRIEYTPRINRATDAHLMLTLGKYGEILEHWQRIFPNILIYSYEMLKSQPDHLVSDLFTRLDLPCDLDLGTLAQPIHTASEKHQRAGWSELPELTPRLHNELVDYFSKDIAKLQKLVAFDVSHWTRKRPVLFPRLCAWRRKFNPV